MPERKIKAVIFDLFFTLINPMELSAGAETEYAVLRMTPADFEKRNSVDYDIRGRGEIRDPFEMIRHILRGLDIPEALLKQAAAARVERIRRAIYGFEPRKHELLRSLRSQGYKIALLSNADAADVYHLRGSPLSGAFDELILSYTTGLLKPEPAIYRLALDRLGVKAGQCLYVGDGGHNELAGAAAMGMTTVLTTEFIARVWPERIEGLKEHADMVIDDLEKIRTILETI